MQTQAKQAVINARQVAIEMAMLGARAFAAGLAVSIAAALLIVGIVTLSL